VSLTADPQDPRLGHGADTEPGQQNDAYLILPEAERAKGFVRPVRLSYRHAGTPGPRWPLRDLTGEEQERYAGTGYVKYEEYPPDDRPSLGRFWTRAQLDSIGKGCGAVTTMNRAIAETYSRSPAFYGATWCCTCRRHLPVGKHGEFTWVEPDGSEAGNRVGT
jgi:hypothetical protein